MKNTFITCVLLGCLVSLILHINQTRVENVMISSFDNDGFIQETVEAESIRYNNHDNTWICKEKTTGKKIILSGRVIIEPIN